VYAATETGIELFRAWLASDVPLETPRAELEIRVAIAKPGDLEVLLGVVESQIKACLAELIGLRQPSLAEVTDESLPWSDAARLLVGDRHALFLQAHHDWLETLQTVLAHEAAVQRPQGNRVRARRGELLGAIMRAHRRSKDDEGSTTPGARERSAVRWQQWSE
jgi:hypothetical protein